MLTEQERNRRKLQGFLDDKLMWHDYTHIVVADDDMDKATYFIHTIGRAKENRAEFIITGDFDHQLAMDIIADADAFDIKNNGVTDNQTAGDEIRKTIVFKDVSSNFVRSQRVAQATSRFGQHIKVFQIVIADNNGLYPFEDGYDHENQPQEMLTGHL